MQIIGEETQTDSRADFPTDQTPDLAENGSAIYHVMTPSKRLMRRKKNEGPIDEEEWIAEGPFSIKRSEVNGL